MTIERTTVHVSDDAGRIAMLEKRTIGTDDAAETLVQYVYSNHLQSASLELDGIGDIISYEEYHPYGTTAFQAKNASINAVAKRYRYTGKERDEESGLYYHGARYYIPWLCRWVSVDPINSENYNLVKGYGLEKNLERHFLHLTPSPYEYCKDNPIGNIDPDGEQAVPLNLPQTVPRTIPMRPPFSRNGFRNTGRGVGMNPNNVIIPPAGNLPARSVQVNDRTGAGYNSAAIEIIRNWFAPEPKGPTPAQSEAGFKKFVEEQRRKQQNFAPFVSPEAKNQYFINQGLQNDVTKLSPIEISKLLNRVALGKGSQQDLAYIPHIPSTYKDGSATLKQFPSLEKILGKEPAKPEEIQFGCEDIAQRVQKLIGGEFLHITPMFGNRLGPVKYEKGEISSWYHHVAVMKDGIVYDKMTGAKGMSFKDYKKMFEYNDAIKFETSNKKNP